MKTYTVDGKVVVEFSEDRLFAFVFEDEVLERKSLRHLQFLAETSEISSPTQAQEVARAIGWCRGLYPHENQPCHDDAEEEDEGCWDYEEFSDEELLGPSLLSYLSIDEEAEVEEPEVSEPSNRQKWLQILAELDAVYAEKLRKFISSQAGQTAYLG